MLWRWGLNGSVGSLSSWYAGLRRGNLRVIADIYFHFVAGDRSTAVA
jgi:hypothetical protein